MHHHNSRLFRFRIENQHGAADGACETYNLDLAGRHAAADFVVLVTTFSTDGLQITQQLANFQTTLRVFDRASAIMPGRDDEPGWIASQLQQAFGEGETHVEPWQKI